MISTGTNCAVGLGCGADHMGTWGWLWMAGGWLVVLVIIGALVWTRRPGNVGPLQPTPEEILSARLARGEISPEEYLEYRSLLER